MKQINWFERNFSFDSTQNIFPSIIERLAGTPARLDEKLKSIPEKFLTIKIDEKWSIQENIGHLIDLEPLWQGRLDDILSSKSEMRPADLQNTLTEFANHNASDVSDLQLRFRKIRLQTIAMLEKLTEENVFKAALHPRLKSPMRTMDLFLFVAEHDDHHLARITELVGMLKNVIDIR